MKRGRPALGAEARAARDAAIVALLACRIGHATPRHWMPAVAPTASGKQNLTAAARAASKLLREIGVRGASPISILRTWRLRDTYDNARADGEYPVNVQHAARILSAARPTTAREVYLWLVVRHKRGAAPLLHPFDIVRTFAAQNRIKK
jgi:hypothetical protein